MTKEEFETLVASVKSNNYSPNLMGECLAYALLQGEWEFQHIGNSCVLLETTAEEQAVVKARSVCKMPGYYVYLLTGGTVKVLEAAQSLNKVMEFLNQDLVAASA